MPKPQFKGHKSAQVGWWGCAQPPSAISVFRHQKVVTGVIDECESPATGDTHSGLRTHDQPARSLRRRPRRPRIEPTGQAHGERAMVQDMEPARQDRRQSNQRRTRQLSSDHAGRGQSTGSGERPGGCRRQGPPDRRRPDRRRGVGAGDPPAPPVLARRRQVRKPMESIVPRLRRAAARLQARLGGHHRGRTSRTVAALARAGRR